MVGTLVVLYSEGAQVKTKSLADSLGQRLRDIVDFNINIDVFEGLDQILGEYQRLNPNISAAGLTVNGKVLIHTDPEAVRKPWMADRHTYEYVIDLTRPEPNANEIHVAVALPAQIVYNQVAATYRFLERVGNVAGPILVGQMFLLAGQSVAVASWTGVFVVALGVLFILWCTPTQIDPTRQEIGHDRKPQVSSR